MQQHVLGKHDLKMLCPTSDSKPDDYRTMCDRRRWLAEKSPLPSKPRRKALLLQEVHPETPVIKFGSLSEKTLRGREVASTASPAA